MFETEAGPLDSPFARELPASNLRDELPLDPVLTSPWLNAFAGRKSAAPSPLPAAPPASPAPQLESSEAECPFCHRPLPPNEVPEREQPEFEHDVLPLRSAARDGSLRDIADTNTVPDEIRAAILRDGETKVNDLTDRAFWIRHPDLKGKPLAKTGGAQQALREEWSATAQQVAGLIWLRQVIDELDKRRGTLPRDFLLGWMAVESDGKVGVVTERPERGYFQIDWPGGEAREQLGLSAEQFRKLSTDREFSIEKGVALVEKYRQFILTNFPGVPDNSDDLWRFTKARHAASGALKDTLEAMVRKKTELSWAKVSPQLPAFMRKNVDATMAFAAKLKPFADLVGSAAPAQPELEDRESPFLQRENGQQSHPAATSNKVADSFAVPFRWIAKISIRKNGKPDQHGTGVLISDRHVLTAAHVVHDVVQDPWQYDLQVTFALNGNKQLDTYGKGKKPDISPHYSKGDLAHDYAIITLQRPVSGDKFSQLGGAKLCFWGSSACGAGTTSVPVEPADLQTKDAVTAGYPGNKGGGEMWVFTGLLASVPAESPIMVFTGDTTEGQSGSPVWLQQNGTYNLVGVVLARGNVNRVLRMTWDVVEQLNTWMLAAEKTPELEFEADESEGLEGAHEVLPAQLAELEEHLLEPKGLVLLDHMQIPRAPSAAAPGTFTTGSLTKMTWADLNPLFFDAGGTVKVDTSPTGLQNCLDLRMASGFGGLLGSPGQQKPGPKDIVHVALVDLTGHKLTAPDFAGWGAPVDMYGASVPKILGLYAAFQLRSDLRDLIHRKSPADGKQLEAAALAEWSAKGLKGQLPDLDGLFDIRKWTPAAALDFTADTQAMFAAISHNCPAGALIARVSLPYIASVAWQSGVYHPHRSGLWLKASYCNKGSWTSPVNPPFIHNATALGAATYFTLLAQGRLVDAASSNDIRKSLAHGCVSSLFPALPVVASKCGIYGGYLHDCAWIQDSNVRYIMCVLSKLSTGTQQALYTQLCGDLDTLIRQNNQTPKSPCT